MRNVFLVGALLLAAGMATAVSVVDTPKVLAAGTGSLTEAQLFEMLGQPDQVWILKNGVKEYYSWNDFVGQLRNTALLGGDPNADVAGPVCTSTWLCGADDGNGVLNAGPFCDNSSAWIQYDSSLTAGGAGSSYITANDNGATSIVTCGGFYGPTRNWDVQMSIYPVITGMLPRVTAGMDGCYATNWNSGPDGYCPRAFTGLDTFGVVSISGPGVKTTFGTSGTVFDYFLGNGASISYGALP